MKKVMIAPLLALLCLSTCATIDEYFFGQYECPAGFEDIGGDGPAYCYRHCELQEDCRNFEICVIYEEHDITLCTPECASNVACNDGTVCLPLSWRRQICVPEIYYDG